MTPSVSNRAFANDTVKRQPLLIYTMVEAPDEEEMEVEGDEAPILTPIETCYVVARDIPVTVKAQLLIIKYQRGWKSWADMIYDVVKTFGGDDE